MKSCNEVWKQKYIVDFLFRSISFAHLESSFIVFQDFIDHDIGNHIKEPCVELFLDSIDEKVDNIAEANHLDLLDDKILYRIFEALQNIMSTNSNLRKLSSVQLKVLSKISSSAEINPGSAINPQTASLCSAKLVMPGMSGVVPEIKHPNLFLDCYLQPAHSNSTSSSMFSSGSYIPQSSGNVAGSSKNPFPRQTAPETRQQLSAAFIQKMVSQKSKKRKYN